MITLYNVIVNLLSLFEKNGINYCILRNYQLLPLDNIGADIDILIDKNSAEDALCLLASISGLRITSTTRRAYVTTAFMDGLHFGKGRDSLQIDFITDLSWKGVRYLIPQTVLYGALVYHAHPLIRIPAPHHEAIISLFSSYLSGGWIKERYQCSVRAEFLNSEVAVRTALSYALSDDLLQRLLDSVQKDDRDELLRLLPKIKIQLVFQQLLKSPILLGWEVLRHYWFEAGIRFTSRPIVQICVLGMDGSGKSTVIKGLVGKFGSRIKAYEVIHLRPKLRRKMLTTNAASPANPHAAPPRNNIMSLLKLLSWVALYHIRKRFHGHRMNTLIVWDRYIYDVLVDPRRYRVDLPMWLLRTVVRLAPAPDAVFVLDLPPEMAFNRKQEVPLAELYSIRQGYIELATSIKSAKVVSTEGSVDEAIEEMVEFTSALMAKLNKPTQR